MLFWRIKGALRTLAGMRVHDLRAARTWIRTMYPSQSFVPKICRFVAFSLRQLFIDIPNVLRETQFDHPASKTPVWLDTPNPLANHPWSTNAGARLPEEVHTVVIGAGFTGAAIAYHWSKKVGTRDQVMLVLEMDDPASGASGRNEGAVVMGRYFAFVRETVWKCLPKVRPDLSPDDREQLARKFAAAYVHAAYRNGDMIEQTIRDEGFDCDYRREGWVQAHGEEQQAALDESVRLADETGSRDWTKISPREVLERTGMRVAHNAGFSKRCASWHPAKWVWCLLTSAMTSPAVKLFTRTKVFRVEDAGEHYIVHTNHGHIRSRFVVNATESYTPLLHQQFMGRLWPLQTQAASGEGGPAAMKSGAVISGARGFWGRHGHQTIFGSDKTRVPARRAGQNKPSRFISKFLLGEMRSAYGPYALRVTNEWSGTVGETRDEYPIVGVMDGKRQFIIAGMIGSGSGVSFNAGRCVVNRILGRTDEPDDYPEEFFSPTRILDPARHNWPQILVSENPPTGDATS